MYVLSAFACSHVIYCRRVIFGVITIYVCALQDINKQNRFSYVMGGFMELSGLKSNLVIWDLEFTYY